MLKQDYILYQIFFKMIANEPKYDKLFKATNEITNYQRLIFTCYNEHQKITKDIINVFEKEKMKYK